MESLPVLVNMGNTPPQEEESQSEVEHNPKEFAELLPRATTPDSGKHVLTSRHEGGDPVCRKDEGRERESNAPPGSTRSNHWTDVVLCDPVEENAFPNSFVTRAGFDQASVDKTVDVAESFDSDGFVDGALEDWCSLETARDGLTSLAQRDTPTAKNYPQEANDSSRCNASNSVAAGGLGTRSMMPPSFDMTSNHSSPLSSSSSSIIEEWENETSTLKDDNDAKADSARVEAAQDRRLEYQTSPSHFIPNKKSKKTVKKGRHHQRPREICTNGADVLASAYPLYPRSSCEMRLERDLAGRQVDVSGVSLGSALFRSDRRRAFPSEPSHGDRSLSTGIATDTDEVSPLATPTYPEMSAQIIEDVASISDPDALNIDTSDFTRRSSRSRKQPKRFMHDYPAWQVNSKKPVLKVNSTPDSSTASTIPAKRASSRCDAGCSKPCCAEREPSASDISNTADTSIRLEKSAPKRAKTQGGSHCDATAIQRGAHQVHEAPNTISDSYEFIHGSTVGNTIDSNKFMDILCGNELLSKVIEAQKSGELAEIYDPHSVRLTNHGWVVRKQCLSCDIRRTGGCDRASPCSQCDRRGIACEETGWMAARSRSKKRVIDTSNDNHNQDPPVTNYEGPISRSTVIKEIVPKEDNRPPPRGKPEVWSVGRQALCETLNYYRAYQSGAYSHDNLTFGCLVDIQCSERDFMDSEIVITRAGGGLKKNPETGEMEQAADHTVKTKTVENFQNNKRTYTPVAVIVGNRNPKCPTKIPHNYCVLGWFKVTEVWCEKVNGMKEFKFRFEKLDLEIPSWWAPVGSEDPLRPYPVPTPALRRFCDICRKSSPQIYTAGWMCLTDSCNSFWKINGIDPPLDLEYNLAFLRERTPWPHKVKPAYDLKPRMLPEDRGNDTGYSVSRACWKGFACPKCGRCNSREDWDAWRCQKTECEFTYNVKRSVMSIESVSNPHDPIPDGHAVSKDFLLSPITETVDFLENYRIHTYTVPGCGTITHFMANRKINERADGPDDLFLALQKADIGLKRFALKNSLLAGPMLTQHFAVNHGMPYKYIVDVDSKSFSGAPEAIHHARARLNWAGQHAVQDGTFTKFNELLTLGYFEKQKINYHDDGEAGLGPTIATLSLGGQATMTIRMKVGHYTGVSKIGAYVDKHPPTLGCLKYEQRLAKHNEIAQADPNEPSAPRKKIIEELGLSRKRTSPVCLSMRLNHGDIVVMHGSKIQTYYEHAVEPSGKLRFAMTCRYIDPNTVNPEHWWKAAYDEDVVPLYDGDQSETQLTSPPLSFEELRGSSQISEQAID